MRRTLLLAAMLFIAGCAARSPSADPAPQVMVVDRLYLGRAIPGGGEVSDSAWADFLRTVVTPRFPEGFTVFRADGQWLGASGVIVREPTMVIELLHPRGQPPDSVLAGIANEYRRRFNQEAVLRSTSDARVLLYMSPPPRH